jgi:Glycosyl transferase family 41
MKTPLRKLSGHGQARIISELWAFSGHSEPRALQSVGETSLSAHTAASDALWVGLPVLTCMGESFVGRVPASLLSAVGLPELVTRSLDEYEAWAFRLATDPALSASIRQKLDGNRKTCPLFDADRLRRDIERVLCDDLGHRSARRASAKLRCRCNLKCEVDATVSAA